jgi:hypothetical protein
VPESIHVEAWVSLAATPQAVAYSVVLVSATALHSIPSH